jgi:hypothetical protein
VGNGPCGMRGHPVRTVRSSSAEVARKVGDMNVESLHHPAAARCPSRMTGRMRALVARMR